MFRSIAAFTVASLLAIAASHAATPEQADAPKPAPQPAPEPPKIVVHHNAAPTDARDGRVDVGGIKISAPGASPAPSTPPAHGDGSIPIPSNTLGPGEPLWQIRERQAAETKLLKANADLARADADRARPTYNDYGYQRDFLPGWRTFGGGGSIGHIRGGLRGPVTTTVIRDDRLGANAQREFNLAATPNNAGNQDAHDRAVRQFGNDAAPRIGPTQNAVDQAQRNANKERPAPKSP